MSIPWRIPRPNSRALKILGSVVALTSVGGPALASLGHGYDSIQTDRVRLAARMTSAATPTYAMHTLVTPNGSVVREFVNPGGVVFAISWRGPGRPDLRQLLGEHFDTLQSETVVRAGRRLRAPLAVDRSTFVVRSGGHPGGFWGVAYLPQELPTEFSAKDLQAP